MSESTIHSRSERPPQFALRTLLFVVTACAVLFALAHWISPIAWAGLLLLIASVALHVAGNAIGTRLRQLGDRTPSEPDAAPVRQAPQPHEFAPVTQLSRRQRLGWVNLIATLVGATSGGIGGGLWTWLASRGPVGPLEIAIGVVSFGVLGGMAAFGAAAFTQVLLGALWQAVHPPTAGALSQDAANS